MTRTLVPVPLPLTPMPPPMVTPLAVEFGPELGRADGSTKVPWVAEPEHTFSVAVDVHVSAGFVATAVGVGPTSVPPDELDEYRELHSDPRNV